MHHAYRGGLLEHTVSMLELAMRICDHYADLDRDLVLVGILFHDLGKLRELGAMPRNDYTEEGRLVGHVVIGRDILLESVRQVPEFPEDVRLRLEHIVLSHQGRLEYRAAVEPATAEALVVHFIDDLDSKLNQLRYLAGDPDQPQYLRGLGRWMYPMASTQEPDEVDTEASTVAPAEATPQSRLDL
jgi:3'-5' exoribonuclease